MGDARQDLVARAVRFGERGPPERLLLAGSRAGQRSEARFVLGFGVAVVVGVTVFGRGTSFLDAYNSVGGQLVLALVAALYGGGMWWLSRLMRFERPARFLTGPELEGSRR